MDLTSKKCIPCEGNTKPLTPEKAADFLVHIPGWEIVENGKKIRKTFEFRNFVKAMAFVDKTADVAESEGHHPDIHIFYNKVTLELWTHAIDGLSENDFILAAKINKLVQCS